MTELKCDTRYHGNFLYGKKQSVFTILYRQHDVMLGITQLMPNISRRLP